MPSTKPLDPESPLTLCISSSVVWGVGEGAEIDALMRRRFISVLACLCSRFLRHLGERSRGHKVMGEWQQSLHDMPGMVGRTIAMATRQFIAQSVV